jgi:RNA polymerase sigma factor (sigma-70 family)
MMARQNITRDVNTNTTDINVIFWQQWIKHKNYLYGCCLDWMGGNPTDAEDALSEAMVKAIEKLRKSEPSIENYKAWLTRLTYSLCMDIQRKRRRNPVEIMDLEAIASEKNDLVIQEEISDPERLRNLELFFGNAIDTLPPRMRETFHLYLQKKYSLKEIAEQLGISYDNARKRMSQARRILQQQWHEYEAGKLSISPPPQTDLKSNHRPGQTKTGVSAIASKIPSLEVITRSRSRSLPPRGEGIAPETQKTRKSKKRQSPVPSVIPA